MGVVIILPEGFKLLPPNHIPPEPKERKSLFLESSPNKKNILLICHDGYAYGLLGWKHVSLLGGCMLSSPGGAS